MRMPGSSRSYAWTSAACIGISLLAMIGISAARPSIVLPALAGMTAWPPWQASLGLPDWILFVMWGVAVIAAAGVVSGLIAVGRGARPRIRPLLAASFIAVAA